MRILIADDDPVSRRVLASTLSKLGHEVVETHNGLEAWEALRADDPPPIALLDWMMPLMDGLEVCRKVRQAATYPTYLILLTAKNSKEDLVVGLEAGADDYLTKPFDRHELRARVQAGARIIELQRSLAERVRELEEAVAERKRAEAELRNLTLTDDLTGLYNRRGFFTLADHRRKLARRMHESSLMIYTDLDGLKQINDRFGHGEGNAAITRTADILRETFRDSDVIARVGGDEFVILVANAPAEEAENVVERLFGNFRRYNERTTREYSLSVSAGAISFDSDSGSTVDQLVSLADEAMYRNKCAKRGLQSEIWNAKSGATGHVSSQLGERDS
jgi:diguanylate cyclase (GGDEF)-like protein